MRFNELTEAVKFTPDMIDRLRNLYDQGMLYHQIAKILNMETKSVINALNRYYPDRPRRQENRLAKLDSQTQQIIADAFLSGKQMASLAKEYDVSITGMATLLARLIGKDRFRQEIDNRKSQPGIQTRDKVTPEMIQTMRKLWAAGTPSTEIAHQLDNVIASRNVLYHMRKQPDFDELQMKREFAQKPVTPTLDATTKIYPPGVMDNLRSKGPGSKNAYGMTRSRKD